jgi:hypothetical protein
MAKQYPATLIEIGSPGGAICVRHTSVPGKQPISSNFKDITSSVNVRITPFSPIFKSAMDFKLALGFGLWALGFELLLKIAHSSKLMAHRFYLDSFKTSTK